MISRSQTPFLPQLGHGPTSPEQAMEDWRTPAPNLASRGFYQFIPNLRGCLGTGLGRIQNLQDTFERNFWKTQQDPKRDGKKFVCSKTWDPPAASCTRMEGLGLILEVPSYPNHSGSLRFHDSCHSMRSVQPPRRKHTQQSLCV